MQTRRHYPIALCGLVGLLALVTLADTLFACVSGAGLAWLPGLFGIPGAVPQVIATHHADGLLVALCELIGVPAPAIQGGPASPTVAHAADRAGAALVGGGGCRLEILTKRERQVLGLVAEGLSNRQIAGRLSVSVNTVRTHVRNVLSKPGVSNRVDATALLLRKTNINQIWGKITSFSDDKPPLSVIEMVAQWLGASPNDWSWSGYQQGGQGTLVYRRKPVNYGSCCLHIRSGSNISLGKLPSDCACGCSSGIHVRMEGTNSLSYCPIGCHGNAVQGSTAMYQFNVGMP